MIIKYSLPLLFEANETYIEMIRLIKNWNFNFLKQSKLIIVYSSTETNWSTCPFYVKDVT